MPGGGFRVPSEDKIQAHAVSVSKTTEKHMELIKTTRPYQVKIYKKDLVRFRAIGKGDWARGFEMVCKLAHSCWLQPGDISRLKKLGDGNARIGLVYAMNAAEEAKRNDTKD